LIKKLHFASLKSHHKMPLNTKFNNKNLINELIPKLKIASLNPVFRIINQLSDHENNLENSWWL